MAPRQLLRPAGTLSEEISNGQVLVRPNLRGPAYRMRFGLSVRTAEVSPSYGGALLLLEMRFRITAPLTPNGLCLSEVRTAQPVD